MENDFSADRLFLSSDRKKTQGGKSINPQRDSPLDECAAKRGINSLSLYVAATYKDNKKNKTKTDCGNTRSSLSGLRVLFT